MEREASIYIAYIITKLELGGAQKICLALRKEVAGPDYKTGLFAGAGGILDSEVLGENDVVLMPALKREITFFQIFSELRAFWFLVKNLRKLRKKYPVVIVHTHSTKAGILGRWAAWLARIPVRVHTVHGFAFHGHMHWLPWSAIYAIEYVTSLITTNFICVSSYDRALGIKLFPRFADKSVIIRAAVESQGFYAARFLLPERTQKPFRFGTVACFKPQKNLIDLLKAFESVAARVPDVYCEIIGDGVQRPIIEKWARDHGLEDRIILHGWCNDVATRMAGWHAFVLTSLWEGLPCAVVEARLLSLPVLAYKTGGIPEVIIPEKNGMLYEQGDWSGLAEGMHRCATDSLWHQALSEYPDELVPFQIDSMVAEHRTLYQRSLGRQKNVS